VAYTGDHTQLALMSLKPGENIGWESPNNLDQFISLEQGRLDLSQDEDPLEERTSAPPWSGISRSDTRQRGRFEARSISTPLWRRIGAGWCRPDAGSTGSRSGSGP
jgi:hypothetical protein